MPSRQQLKRLELVLINAFPSKSLLERLLYYELDKNLNEITSDSNLQTVVFQLIQKAEAQAWLIDLVRSARKENPGNSELEAIAGEFFSIVEPKPTDDERPQTPNNQEPQKILLLATLPQNLLGLVSKLEILIWEFISQFKAQYYQHLIYTYRTYRTQGLKTPGACTPNLDKVFVPLRMLSKSPIQMSQALIQKETFGDFNIWHFLAQIRDELIYKHIVVIAPPGYGKTTLLEHLTLTYAQNAQRQKHPKAPRLIPILLYLRKIRDRITNPQPPNLAQLVTEVVKTESTESSTKLNPPLQWFQDKLIRGKCLVMLDGLDEVADTNQRQQVSQWVDVQMKAYPETTFILTSRLYGYLEAQLQQQPFFLEVQPFSLKQMEEFINNWYLQNEIIRQGRKEDPGVQTDARRKANDLIGCIKQNSALASMALNPLLLTMIATVHDNRGTLPGSRVELYAEICEVLLARRQEVKGIDYSIQLKAAQLQSVLQVLALNLMQQKTREFNLDIGKQIIKRQLKAVSPITVNPESFFKYIEQVSGLLLEKQQGIYEFAHKSFQEYLTAVQMKELSNEQILINNINESWWDETIRLYAAKSDTSNLIRAALKNSNVISLSIAYDCLLEGMSVEPSVRQELESTLEAGLKSDEPEIFQLAAQVKLRRRLSKLVRIDEQLEIDNDSYITYAEYQLFLDETGIQNKRFPALDAKRTISGINWNDANRFCVWLKLWSEKQGLNSQLTESVTFYRLPTQDERTQHPINDDQQFSDGGIRIIKFQLPSRYWSLD
ncbi:MAG: effector-associated domain EAD1-containing protein [Rhizonema sp. PD37]|nr:effector-associated domain EAD1-containing protein [Rhizonema sp. PD37]